MRQWGRGGLCISSGGPALVLSSQLPRHMATPQVNPGTLTPGGLVPLSHCRRGSIPGPLEGPPQPLQKDVAQAREIGQWPRPNLEPGASCLTLVVAHVFLDVKEALPAPCWGLVLVLATF